MVDNNDFLYHYTSFETLALILNNRTICFNSLQNVDDMEEAETADMGKFGKFVYVSCWTDDPKELISLWNLYTPNMQGVRIGLPRCPFKKFTFRAGQYHLTNDVNTYIDLGKVYIDDKALISIDQPKLIRVEYTDDTEKLLPKVRTCTPYGAVERYLNANSLKEVGDIKVGYSFEKLGRYKRKDWEFQHEWRYIITMSPMGLQESYLPFFRKQQEYIRRIESPTTRPPYDRFFLDLDENTVKQMEIVLGPRMNEAEKIYVKTLLKAHGLEHSWRESALRIR